MSSAAGAEERGSKSVSPKHSRAKSGVKRPHADMKDSTARRKSLPAGSLSAKSRRTTSLYEDSDSAQHSQEVNTQPLPPDEEEDLLPDTMGSAPTDELADHYRDPKSQPIPGSGEALAARRDSSASSASSSSQAKRKDVPVPARSADRYSSPYSHSGRTISVAAAHAARFSSAKKSGSGRRPGITGSGSGSGTSSGKRTDGDLLADRHSVNVTSSSPLSESPVALAEMAASSAREDYKRRQLAAAKKSMAMKKRRVVI